MPGRQRRADDREVVGLGPPEVKTTWLGSAPTAAATSLRACSSPARAARPNRWHWRGCRSFPS